MHQKSRNPLALMVFVSAIVAGAMGGAASANPAAAGKHGLSPPRDLRGTWASPLRGKGYQLSGVFAYAGKVVHVLETGDIRLVVTRVTATRTGPATTNYKAYGTVSFTNFKLVSSVGIPKQSGEGITAAAALNVSGTRVGLQPLKLNGATVSMQGSFTTSILSGTMTKVYPGGAMTLKGPFNLMRQR